MSDINPIDLPTAAGVEFGRGDVRHFSESDAVDVVGLQNPTRQLAERDNLLAAKVNEVVSAVNNKEQFVPLSVPRTLVAPGVQEIVANFAIPVGFEARILNASVGTTPLSSSANLVIYYAPGYGNVTGTQLFSTSSTFTSGISFYNGGEFIIALINNGNTHLECVASITLTVRPIGSTAGLLVGSVISGPQGLPGQKGDRGLQGPPGSGGAGTPGLNWRGSYASGNGYAPPDAVSFTSGGVTQSYISILSNPATPNSAAPPNGTYWGLLVSAGSAGAGMNWRGAWSASNTYAASDAVSYVSNGITSSYICILARTPTPTTPFNDPTHWDLFAGPVAAGQLTYSVDNPTGNTWCSAGFMLGTGDGDYIGLGNVNAGGPSQKITPAYTEASFISSQTTPFGVALLQYQERIVSSGTKALVLPQTGDGAAVNWLSSSVNCMVSVDGTASAAPDTLVKITSVAATGSIVVVIEDALPVKNTLNIFGIQQIV